MTLTPKVTQFRCTTNELLLRVSLNPSTDSWNAFANATNKHMRWQGQKHDRPLSSSARENKPDKTSVCLFLIVNFLALLCFFLPSPHLILLLLIGWFEFSNGARASLSHSFSFGALEPADTQDVHSSPPPFHPYFLSSFIQKQPDGERAAERRTAAAGGKPSEWHNSLALLRSLALGVYKGLLCPPLRGKCRRSTANTDQEQPRVKTHRRLCSLGVYVSLSGIPGVFGVIVVCTASLRASPVSVWIQGGFFCWATVNQWAWAKMRVHLTMLMRSLYIFFFLYVTLKVTF